MYNDDVSNKTNKTIPEPWVKLQMGYKSIMRTYRVSEWVSQWVDLGDLG